MKNHHYNLHQQKIEHKKGNKQIVKGITTKNWI